MKDEVLKILNRKINQVLRQKDQARREGDLFRMGISKRVLEILTEVVKEIQTSV